jgi:hypothetical protein
MVICVCKYSIVGQFEEKLFSLCTALRSGPSVRVEAEKIVEVEVDIAGNRLAQGDIRGINLQTGSLVHALNGICGTR